MPDPTIDAAVNEHHSQGLDLATKDQPISSDKPRTMPNGELDDGLTMAPSDVTGHGLPDASCSGSDVMTTTTKCFLSHIGTISSALRMGALALLKGRWRTKMP